jgi:ribonuclease R
MSNKKPNSWHQMDPFFAREQEKYGRASPSREFILQYLTERGMPITLDELRAEWRWTTTGKSKRCPAGCGRWSGMGN